jgi:stage II sporulation protein D
MGLEEYLCGVVAGEMNCEWPMEALKAQAILARTFVLRFMTEKQSKYEGADISTDIEEAQAYRAQAINDRIRKAVGSTRGMVLSFEGEFPYAWFHAHSGGQTTGAVEGLNWKEEEPGYTLAAQGRESDEAAWDAAFNASEVRKAAQECGVQIHEIKAVEMGEKGKSGRLMTLLINDRPVSAADFRVAIGSEKMKSTLLTELTWREGKLCLSGKGYGHGVGMSQWGAREMALQGADAETIIDSYFRNIEVVKVY